MANILNGKVPPGSISDKWVQYKSTMNLVAPNNKRNIEVIVVGMTHDVCHVGDVRMEPHEPVPPSRPEAAGDTNIVRIRTIR